MNIEQEIEKLPESEQTRFEKLVEETLDARDVLCVQLREEYSDSQMTNLREQVYHIYHQLFA